MLDHPHPIDAPDGLAIHNKIGDAENAGLDRGVDLSFQRVLGVVCLDVAEQRWHVNAEVFGLIGDVIGSP